MHANAKRSEIFSIDVKVTARRAKQLIKSDKKFEKHRSAYPEDQRERLKRRKTLIWRP